MHKTNVNNTKTQTTKHSESYTNFKKTMVSKGTLEQKPSCR